MTDIADKKISRGGAAHDHAGHRQRMKERVLQYGIDSLADHEVLEVLLYSAVPRGDTNALAHRLLRQFGSLSQVLQADPLDLQHTGGVSPNTAFLLSFSAQLAGRYLRDKNRSRPILGSSKALLEYIQALYIEYNIEVAYLLCLNASMQVNQTVKLGEGNVGGVSIHLSGVVENALRHRARSVVLVHNHPGGISQPSKEDFELTKQCIQALRYVDVGLLDHVVVCGSRYFSFAQMGYIQNFYNQSCNEQR